jgi:hypothetical protein
MQCTALAGPLVLFTRRMEMKWTSQADKSAVVNTVIKWLDFAMY